MKYRGKIVGEFTKTQEVEADSLEAATEALKGNTGTDIEETATGDLEVSDVEEVA